MKKILLRALIVAFAIGTSAFIRIRTTVLQDHLVQPTIGTFIQLVGPFNPNNCTATTIYHCAYDIKPEYKSNIPDQASYSPSNIDYYLSQGWIEPNFNSSNALYEQE